MSAVTSPNSPRFEPSSGDLFAFDGAEELSQAWRDGLTPDPALTVSEWADRHRVLSPRASAEPGRYRTDRTPYMRAIIDALSPTHPARRIVVMKSAQVGFWEAATTDEAKRSFKNSVLGETWVETGEAPDWQRLYERRESWQIGVVPSGGLFLTAGADVQKDRIEVDVWAWGRGLESWLVDHIVVEGGPEQAGTWEELARLLDRTWSHAQPRSPAPT